MATPAEESISCAILADRNTALADRLRSLLGSVAGSVFLVGDDSSLLDGARRLRPDLIILDLGFAEGGMASLLRVVRTDVPEARVIVLALHDDPAIAETAIAEGARGVVLKGAVADELLDAVDVVTSGGTFVSRGFSGARRDLRAAPDGH